MNREQATKIIRGRVAKWEATGDSLPSTLLHALVILADEPDDGPLGEYGDEASTYTPGVWYGWSGGECPVDGGAKVEIETADGVHGESMADELAWHAGFGNATIARFRIVPKSDHYCGGPDTLRVCPVCGGDGGGHDSIPPCMQCGGSGEVPDDDPGAISMRTCPTCQGTASNATLDGYCETCGGAGSVPDDTPVDHTRTTNPDGTRTPKGDGPDYERNKTDKRYSGDNSHEFWQRIRALTGGAHRELYSLGVALQNLEGFVLKALVEAEAETPEPHHSTEPTTNDAQTVQSTNTGDA